MAKRITIRMNAARYSRDSMIVFACVIFGLFFPLLLFVSGFPVFVIIPLSMLLAGALGAGSWWILRRFRSVLVFEDEFLIQQTESGEVIGQLPFMNIQSVELLGGDRGNGFENIAIGIRLWNKKDRDTVWHTYLPLNYKLSRHDAYHTYVLNEWDYHFNKLFRRLDKAAEESRQDRLTRKRIIQ